MSKKRFVGKKKEKHEIIYRNPNKLIRGCVKHAIGWLAC